MGRRQKGKSHKRKRSWHRRGDGPDRAWMRAVKKLNKAMKGVTSNDPGTE